ncbi:Rpn family recombination-promoting nuclease/putative transposase, partial [Desulfonatronospira sp.]
MSKIKQAHDKIFKNVFSDRKNALNLLGNFLPANILNRLD